MTNTYVETFLGSGCGAVGSAVAFNIRDPRFESQQRQIIYLLICQLHDLEKTKIKKRPGKARCLKRMTRPLCTFQACGALWHLLLNNLEASLHRDLCLLSLRRPLKEKRLFRPHLRFWSRIAGKSSRTNFGKKRGKKLERLNRVIFSRDFSAFGWLDVESVVI